MPPAAWCSRCASGATRYRQSRRRPDRGPVAPGALHRLANSAAKKDALPLALVVLFGVFGLFSLDLSRRLGDRIYLWFGLLSTGFGGYTFLRTQWKYATGLDFVVLKEIEYALLFALPPIFVELLWRLLGRRVGRSLRALQAFDAAVLAPRSSRVALQLPALAGVGGDGPPVLGATVVVLTRDARGNPEARIVGLSMSLGALAIANDIAVDYGVCMDRGGLIGFGLVIGARRLDAPLLRAHAGARCGTA
jgi:hypothetical protein